MSRANHVGVFGHVLQRATTVGYCCRVVSSPHAALLLPFHDITRNTTNDQKLLGLPRKDAIFISAV